MSDRPEDLRRFYVRWKVADLRITGAKLWSVIRLEDTEPIEVGKFDSLEASMDCAGCGSTSGEGVLSWRC